MPLFPAYASTDAESEIPKDGSGSVSPAREVELLASDSESCASAGEEAQPPAKRRKETSHKRRKETQHKDRLQEEDNQHFYVDRKLERAYYGVSTLYWPGRPQYEERDLRAALGAAATPRAPRRVKRYYASAGGGGAGEGAAHAAAAAEHAHARAAHYRRLLADNPADEQLWIEYIDFMEWCGCGVGGAGAAAAEAERAVAALAGAAGPGAAGPGAAGPGAAGPGAAGQGAVGAALHDRLHAALRRALTHNAYIDKLKEMISQGSDEWVRLAGAACAGGAGGAPGALAAVRGAVQRAPQQYPLLLYIYGTFLVGAGLWEQASQLVELVCATVAPHRPPPQPTEEQLQRMRRAEDELVQYELKCVRSALPVSVVWSRVERARAALHWRASPGADAADPQRAPHPHVHADLLVPLVARGHLLHVLAALLRLAETPLVPLSSALYSELLAGEAGRWCSAEGALLLGAVRAARRLPPAAPARAAPAEARALAARAPLRPYTQGVVDPTGYPEWREWLWSLCLEECGAGEARDALVCWRLRDLHARLMLLQEDTEWCVSERRRVRTLAREAAGAAGAARGGRWCAAAGAARAEAAAAGAARGHHVALAALRAALADEDAPHHHLLYLARVCEELCPAGLESWSAWARVCAVLRAPLPGPARAQPPPPPPADIMDRARDECARHCSVEAGACAGPWWRRMLPHAGAEWAAARMHLAPPGQLPALVADLHQALQHKGAQAPACPDRALEATACAVRALGARVPAALRRVPLAHYFPHNAYLALAESGGVWSLSVAPSAAPVPRGADSPVGAVCGALPALLRHLRDPHNTQEALRAARACGVVGGAGAGAGALLGALGLHALLHAPRDHHARALRHTLARHPHCKAVYVSPVCGAGSCGALCGELPDMLLDRQLRLHALPQELDIHDTKHTTV